MTVRKLCAILFTSMLLALAGVRAASPVGTGFTFQGQLRHGTGLANGPCDFQFGLFDAPTAGMQIGTTVTTTITVANGLFTAGLDFGSSAFTGPDRFLEIGVRCPAGTGAFTTLAPRQPITPTPYSIFSPVVIRNADGEVRASMGLLQDGGGIAQVFGPNGNANVILSSLTDNGNFGFAGVYDAAGAPRASMQVLNPTGDGFIITRGPNGNSNVRVTSLLNFPNNGFVSVDDADGNTQAGIYVNDTGQGIVFGDMKNFVVDHPNHAGMKIMYTSLEGPEAAIYYRGSVRLVSGRATIELPEHFTALADSDTITVQLTPGSLASKGLGFGAIHDGRIEIGELQHGKGSYEVHFVVHAVRKGYEDLKPVLSAAEFAARFGQMVQGEVPAPKSAGPLRTSANR
jgi:hypothetical protein